jgi:uridine phosphorylase
MSMLSIPEERIPKALILRGTRNLKSHYAAYRQRFTNVLDIGSPNGVIEDVFIGNLDGIPVAYASVYGAPMASEIVHIFGVLGTPLVIQTGCCGGIADGLNPGDLFIAESAYTGEGASQYYISQKVTKASISFDDLIAAHCGKIYTTSALFAEGEAEINQWYKQGFAAVDMETSATFSVAEYFGMDRGSILFVFDNPRQKEHIFLGNTEKDKFRDLGNTAMIDASLAVAMKYSNGP